MAPRPLKQVKRKIPGVEYTISSAALGKQPEMATLAMQVIAGWSEIDSLVTAAVVAMLGGYARPAIAMVLALTSTQAQMAAMEASAREILTSDLADMFQAVMAVIRKAVKRRHMLAHWIWARV